VLRTAGSRLCNSMEIGLKKLLIGRAGEWVAAVAYHLLPRAACIPTYI
jgi:hypothetical protein